MAIEEAEYMVIQSAGAFELREYKPYVLAETIIEGNQEDASSRAFRILFNYITGENKTNTKVAMTAPVSQEAVSEKIAMTAPVSMEQVQDKWAVSFMMPQNFTLSTLPTPRDSRVHLREVSGRKVAVIRYSGFWTEKSYTAHRLKLEEWIEHQKFQASGPAIWARFNAPYTPWFLRRNEVQIPITDK